MSETNETPFHAKLNQQIDDILAANGPENGIVVTGWILVVKGILPDGRSASTHYHSDLPVPDMIGMLEMDSFQLKVANTILGNP